MTTSSTRHALNALRYLLTGDQGILEFRISVSWAVVIYHDLPCTGENCNPDVCDAEAMPGTEVALAWRAENHSEAAIWRELESRYLSWELSTLAP